MNERKLVSFSAGSPSAYSCITSWPKNMGSLSYRMRGQVDIEPEMSSATTIGVFASEVYALCIGVYSGENDRCLASAAAAACDDCTGAR